MALAREQFARLVPDESRFAEYLAFLSSLHIGIEDYSVDLVFENAVVLSQLQRLHMQLQFCKEDSLRLWIANVVVDMLLNAALIPSAIVFYPGKHDVHFHYDYSANVTRFWIQGLPMDLVEEMIKELRLGCSGAADLKHSVLLC